ncbi:MAG: hypothetical protein WCN97_08635 [Thermoleophilia bacterium]
MQRRHLIPIILALLVALTTASAASAATRFDHTRQAASFFHHAVPAPGFSITNVWVVPDKLQATKITVTSDVNGVVTANAALQSVNGGTLNGTLVWTNNCHWKITFVADSTATSASAPTTTIKLNHIDGFISNVGCEHHAQLTLKGYSIGESKVDINLSIVKNGFEGSTEITNLVLGKTTYPRVKLSVSTLSTAARLEGEMASDLGNFTIDAQVTAPHGSYHQDLTVTGADLKVESPSFEFVSFHYHTVFDIPNGGCASYKAQIGGQLKMKNWTYTLLAPYTDKATNAVVIPTEIQVSCGVVKVFKLGIDAQHEEAAGKYKKATLIIALMNTPGTEKDVTSGVGDVNGHFGTIEYQKGLFGYVDLAKGREFSEKFGVKGFKRCFCVHIRLGIIFGVAIYVPKGASNNTYHSKIGAGGYFQAGRVDGSFGCVYEHTTSNDFSCQGKFTVDPSWAGKYTRHWSGF